MKVIILKRIVVSFITSIIFTIVSSILFMNDAYGFGFYFIAIFIYGTPAIFLIGIPVSLLLEVLLTRFAFKNKYLYLTTLIVLYACAGFIGTWLYFFILANGDLEFLDYKEILSFTLFGVLAALLFLVGVHNLEIILRKIKSTK